MLDLLAAAGVPEAVHAARSTFGKEDRQRSSIYTTVETILEPFADVAGRDRSGRPMPARRPGPPDPRSQHPLPVCSGPRSAAADAAVRLGDPPESSNTSTTGWPAPGVPLDPPLLVVLDEAANIAPLSDLDALASTAAGHGMQLVTIWHDLAQITARYGPRATTVVNNHRAKLFLSGISDPSTLDYASHLIGEEEVLLPAVTHGGRGMAPSTTYSPSVRRLAPPDALRRIAPGEGVLVYGDLPPARLHLRLVPEDRPRIRGRPHADPDARGALAK